MRNKNDPQHMGWLRMADWEQRDWKTDPTTGARKLDGQWGLVSTAQTGLLHASWLRRAESVVRANLSLFTPDGRASAAHLYAWLTNGQRGARNDPWANDQDWALVYLLMVRDLAAGR